MKARLYLASHFFNDAMFQWTEELAQYLEAKLPIDLYVPQRNDSINDKENCDAEVTDISISKADTAELRRAQILLACLDGLSIDDGVAGEVMAFGLIHELEVDFAEQLGDATTPRLIIGLITDMRWLGTGENKLYRNQMILGKVKEHGQLVVGYPGRKEAYREDIVKIIQSFLEENDFI